MLGMHGTEYANQAVMDADFILGIGNRFDDRTIGNPKFFGEKARSKNGIVHVDISPSSIQIAQKTIHPDLSLQCDAGELLSFIVSGCKPKKRMHWRNKIRTLKRTLPLDSSDSHLRMLDIIHEINRVMYKMTDYYICTGVGNHQMKIAQHFLWKYPNRLLTSGSLGSMGSCLGFGIGASSFNDRVPIICVDGDGSIMMSIQELATIAQYQLPIKIIIMNNSDLNMISTWQKIFYDGNFVANKLLNPDFVKLGKSFGIPTFQCRKKSYLKKSIHRLFQTSGPCILDVHVISEDCLPFVAPGSALNQNMKSAFLKN
jgi:acetolactate synthase-1/2/3 large subunit